MKGQRLHQQHFGGSAIRVRSLIGKMGGLVSGKLSRVLVCCILRIVMPRALRSEFTGQIYHALNRGNTRSNIFFKDADFEAFERVIKEGLEKGQRNLLLPKLPIRLTPFPFPSIAHSFEHYISNANPLKQGVEYPEL